MKRALGPAALLVCASSFGLDRPVRQVVIESKLIEVGPGVISADFDLNLGHVYVNFPSDIAPGERISGSLAAVPKGKSEAERSANATALRALDVEICGSKFSIDGGFFVCPRVSSERTEVLLDIEPIGRLFVEPKAVTLPGQAEFVLPVEGVALGRSRILGPFGGDVTATSLSIGGARAHIVGESPRSCVFDVPEAPIGPGRIELRDGARSESGPFRIVGLHLTPPKPIIHTGDTTSFAAEVYGLSGLDHALPLVLKNLSTDVVSMEGGEEQTLEIAPARVSPAGTFAISRKLGGLHRGDYIVNVSVPWAEGPVKDAARRSGSPGEGPIAGEAASHVLVDDAIKKLPAGYKIVRGENFGFHAEPDTLRPGLPLAWDEAHHAWTPPGFVPDPTDPDRAFNQTTGGNAVWDEKSGGWIDAATGEPLSYEQ